MNVDFLNPLMTFDGQVNISDLNESSLFLCHIRIPENIVIV